MEHQMDQKLLRDLLRFFYLQRCGCALPETDAGVFAHTACHTDKACVYGTNEKRDVSGGWHDAGDYGRYTVPAAKAVADLLLAYQTAPSLFAESLQIPESENGIPDILNEARYELLWLFKMQREDGAVFHKVSCANFCGFLQPDEETEPLILSPVSTAATGGFAGIMAMAYSAYKPFDQTFADTCLAAGKRAYDFLQKAEPAPFHNPPKIVTGEYDDENDADERFYAAAALFAATGEDSYAQQAKALFGDDLPLRLGWADMAGYGCLAILKGASPSCALYQEMRSRLLAEADRLAALSENDPYGISLAGEFLWGSNMYLANNAILLGEAYRLTTNPRYRCAAQRHYAYLLGENPLSMCYVTGHCAHSPLHPHHRPSVAANTPMPGMLVGGPDAELQDPCAQEHLTGRAPAECYIDDTMSYSTNEVTIYWNSAMIYCMALLA